MLGNLYDKLKHNNGEHMTEDSFWNNSWNTVDMEKITSYTEGFDMSLDPIIQHLKEIDARNICDAGCGCGIYSLKLAMNGFKVSGFDVAENAVTIAKNILAEKRFVNDGFKTASVVDTGFSSGYFDAVVSRDVVDHMPIRQAVLAIKELLRITKPGGSVILTLDGSDEEYESEPHTVSKDGDYLFNDGKWNGMVFHPYSEAEIEKLTNGYSVKHIDRIDDGYVVIIGNDVSA